MTSYKVSMETEESRYDSRDKLSIVRDDVVVATHYDGGEPEDNRFYRDWAWVASALEQAYEFGREDGRREK